MGYVLRFCRVYPCYCINSLQKVLSFFLYAVGFQRLPYPTHELTSARQTYRLEHAIQPEPRNNLKRSWKNLR